MLRAGWMVLLTVGLALPLAAQEGDYLPADGLRAIGLEKFWQVRLPLAIGQSVEAVHLVDDQVYAGTNDGVVFAVHAYTGAIRWAQVYTTGGYSFWAPTHIDGITVITTPPDVTQFDRHYGKPIRRNELRFPAGNSAVSSGNLLLIGSLNRRMYALRPQHAFETWKVLVDAELIARPAVWRDLLYFASSSGTVYACQAANKQFAWQARLGGSVSAPLVAGETGVYVANRDHSLYQLDPVFGGVRWRLRFNSPLEEAPVVTPETAYQYAPVDGLVAVDAVTTDDDARIRWRFERGRQALTEAGGDLYALTRDGRLTRLDTASGRPDGEVSANGFALAMPSTDKPAVMLAHRDGRIFCAQHEDEPFVTADEVRAALRLGGAAEDKEVAAADEPAPAEDEDFLGTRDGQPPTGGKSKVSQGYGGGGG